MNDATGVLWRRLRYFLTPQFDLYQSIARKVVGKSVLDIGCGTGFGALQLARTARDVWAIDVDPEAIRFAESCIPGVHWQCADILDRTWANGRQWDFVLMVEVLEHITLWREALDRVKGLLNPGGYFIMTARNANADLRRVELHEREWTARELSDNLFEFFANVRIYDHTLDTMQLFDTHITPLIAVANTPPIKVDINYYGEILGVLNPTHPDRYDATR